MLLLSEFTEDVKFFALAFFIILVKVNLYVLASCLNTIVVKALSTLGY